MRLLQVLIPLGALALAAQGITSVPPLAALVTTEQRQTTADGLTKQVRFQERLVRAGDRVWLERVIPQGAPGSGESQEHHHLDLDVAARFVQRDSSGAMHVAFVHRGERTVVQTEPRDYPEVGFHDSWAVVSHLVDPAILQTMRPLARRATEAGARWYEKRTEAGYLRVQWSSRRKIALAVESGSADGHRFHRTTVAFVPYPKVRPWEELGGYAQKEYTDLLD